MTVLAAIPDSRWSRSRWLGTIAFLLGLHLLLILLFSEYPEPTRLEQRPQTKVAYVSPADVSPDLAYFLEVHDPTLFALPHPKNVSGSAWFHPARTFYHLTNSTDPPRWLVQDPARLATGFALLANQGPQTFAPMADKLPLAPPSLPMAASSSFPRSLVWLEGPLAERNLLSPIQLPAQEHENVLSNSVVRVVADTSGFVLSATLLSGCGSSRADAQALRLAKGARFRPLPDAAEKSGGRYTIGIMNFQWATSVAAATNTPAAKS